MKQNKIRCEIKVKKWRELEGKNTFLRWNETNIKKTKRISSDETRRKKNNYMKKVYFKLFRFQ